MDVELRIERYADQGRCVAHLDGRVVFVRFALPGELVRVRLDEPHKRQDRYCTGEVIEVLEASPDRREPVWPMAGPLAWGGGLGGADLIHVSLPGQLTWKADLIRQQMGRLGGTRLEDVPIARPDDGTCPDGLHWRTRIDLVADDQGRPSMRRRGSHERVALESMPLASRRLLDQADELGLWNGGFKPGSRIRMAVPEPLDSQGTDGNFALQVDGRTEKGSDPLTERIRPNTGRPDEDTFTYRVDAGGFWQIHRLAPSLLSGAVLTEARRRVGEQKAPVVWDLYSGAGLFTLPLAAAFGGRSRILAVEGAAGAVTRARENLAAADMTNAEVRRGDVGRVLRHGVPKALAHPDLVLLDPPRAGAKAEVCRLLNQAAPSTIIYVACDPTSLARDTGTLLSLGYELADIHAYDIYPMTHHVETMAVFTR